MRNASNAALLLSALVAVAGCAVADQSRSDPPQANQAAEKTPQAQEEQATAPQQTDPSGEQAAPRPPQPRRSVQANIQRVQPIPQSGATSYGPVLTPGARPSPLPSPAPTAGLPPPAQINNCAGGHCTDAAGNSYNLGTGDAGTDSQGRLCNRTGNTVQCF